MFYKKEGKGETIPSLKSLSNVEGGIVVANEVHLNRDTDSSPTDDLAENLGADESGETGNAVEFHIVKGSGAGQKTVVEINDIAVHDATFSEKNARVARQRG